MTADQSMIDLIAHHQTAAGLSARYVGGAPTYEWTGRATPALLADLRRVGAAPTTFIANVREHPDFGRRCVAFTVFGKTGKE